MTEAYPGKWTQPALVVLWCLGILLTESTSAQSSHPEEPNMGDLLVHVVSPISSKMILPDTFPLPGERTSTLRISACRGEFEPASFVLRAPGQHMTRVTLKATELQGVSSSAVISSSHVDMKIVKPWFQNRNAWNDLVKSDPEDFRQKLVPELLLKDDALVRVEIDSERNFVRLERSSPVYEWVNQKKLAYSKSWVEQGPTIQEFPVRDAKALQPFDLPRNTTKQVWVTIFVPHDTPPDQYFGAIEVRSNGALQEIIKINLKVHSFELAESKISHSIYYRAVLDDSRPSVGSEHRNAEQMMNELQNLLNHGVRNPTLYQPLPGKKLLREALQLRQDLGMNKGPLYYIGAQTTATFLGNDTIQAEKNLRAIFLQIDEIARAYGFTSVYIYGKDEALDEDLVAQRRLWDIVHGLGGKIFVAEYIDSFALVGDLLDLLVHAHQPSAHEADRWHGNSNKIFNYHNPQSGPENPFLFRLNYGIMLWANNFDGAMPYAYQHCFGSCWNDLDHPRYRDHALTYPTADGVIDTLAWEGFREASDDVRYLTTLENLLSKDSTNSSLAANQARLYLSTLKATILSKQKRSGQYNLKMDIDLDVVRSQVVGHINAIANER